MLLMMLAYDRFGMLGLFALCAAVIAGCGEEDGGTAATGGTTGAGGTPGMGGTTATGGTAPDPGLCASDGNIVITDATNYSFSSVLTIASTTVKDAVNLNFDWSGITTDFFGRAVNPTTDIDLVLVSLWGMNEADLSANMNRDNLPLSDNKGALTFYPTEVGNPAPTSSLLLDFSSFHNEVPEEEIWSRFDTATPGYQYPQDSHTFMVTVQTGTDPGRDARMLGFFRLDPTSTNTTVSLNDASTTMTWSVSLANITQFSVPAATPTLTIDWSQMTTNAIGNPYDVTQITQAVVAHYPTYTLTDLEQRFLFLEEEAGDWYAGDVLAGTSMNLSTLKNAAGVTFPGVDATGVWLIALFCTENCNNPAPWSITVIKPCQ
jgi:hypothetical protein